MSVNKLDGIMVFHMANRGTLARVVTPIVRTTLTASAFEKLISHVMNGDWKPGDRILPERKLCQQLGIARTAGTLWKPARAAQRGFGTEFFNFTSTPTFFLPAANSPTLTCIRTPGSACDANNASFGKLSSGSATGRQIQFGLKLYFLRGK